MTTPNIESAYRAARKNARPLATVYFRDVEDKAAGEIGAAAHALHRARGNLAEYTAALDAIPADTSAPDYRQKLKRATAARNLCVTYGADYGAGTWQGGHVPTSPEEQAAGREADAAARARAPFQGVPPAMRNRGGGASRFPSPRCMDKTRKNLNGGDGGRFALNDGPGAAAVFRDVRDAEDVPGMGRRDGLSWICDPWGDYSRDGEGLCVAMVARLRNRDGRAVFAPGFRFGGHDDSGVFDMSALVYSDPVRAEYYDSESIVEDAQREAARAAGRLAEAAAEREREYQTAWAAGSQWSDKGERLGSIREEVREILAERRTVRGVVAPALCRAIRDRVASLWEERADLIRDRRKLAEGDESPLYFWTGEERLREAFCEGAGVNRFPA